MFTFFTDLFFDRTLKKKIWCCVAALIFCSAFGLQAQDPFITTWRTTTADETITIPTNGGGYNYSVNWGDGTTDATLYTGNATHQYAVAGTYTVSINGTFPRIYFNNGGDKSKILTVQQWGDIHWTAMDRAFYGCNNLTIPATDAPDLSAVTSMFRMFYQASSFNQPIGHWNVSTIISMNSMFFATPFNQDLSAWDVSNVTDMLNMFSSTPFNQNIGNWNVSNVTNMGGMFASNGAFNQDISNWNVSKVTTMSSMFANAFAFNQDISTWNTSNVTNMSFMFFQNNGFDQNLGSWNISKVTNMASMLLISGLSVKNYTATLNGWAAQTGIATNISLGATGLKYCDQDGTGHADLIAKGWTISDAGISCPVPPVLNSIGNKSVGENKPLSFSASATAGDLAFTFKLDPISLAKGMSINGTNGQFTWTPGHAYLGENLVTITADDQEYGDSETIVITVVNNDPVLAAIGSKSVNEDEQITFAVTATDDPLNTLIFSLDAISLGKGMVVDVANGNFNWTPNQTHIGNHSVTLSVSDGSLSDSETFTITVNSVNDAPTLTHNLGLLLIQGDSELITAELLSAADDDNTPVQLVYTIITAPVNGELKKSGTALAASGTFTQADINAGLISYDHNGFNGATDGFTFTLTDGSGGNIGATDFTITVDIVTGIEPETNSQALVVFPNPASETVQLRLTNNYYGSVMLELQDVAGRRLQSLTIIKSESAIDIPVDLPTTGNGLFIMQVNMGNVRKVVKVMKQ